MSDVDEYRDGIGTHVADWHPEPRPVVPELTAEFEAPSFPKPATKFADWTTQLEAASFDVLRSYANGGTGSPETD